MATTPIDARTKAAQPASMTDEHGGMTQFPLPDQLEADRYEANKAAVARQRRGIRFMRVTPPGPVD